METNLKKLEELLKEEKVYLSAKEYEEADKLKKIELLREFIFKSGDIAYNEDKEKLSHHFNKCMSLSDDGAKNKATSWGGEYAGLLDKKYYDYDGNSYTAKAEIENTPLYKQLAWCAISETLNREMSYRQAKAFEKNWRYRSLYGIEIERAVNAILMKKWDAMEKKYPYTDYESTIKNPWYKDEAKLQTFINDVEDDIAPIFENHMEEHERCNKKMFEGGRIKCKAKANAKTLKMLEAKL